jgi:hypothetical protein
MTHHGQKVKCTVNLSTPQAQKYYNKTTAEMQGSTPDKSRILIEALSL